MDEVCYYSELPCNRVTIAENEYDVVINAKRENFPECAANITKGDRQARAYDLGLDVARRLSISYGAPLFKVNRQGSGFAYELLGTVPNVEPDNEEDEEKAEVTYHELQSLDNAIAIERRIFEEEIIYTVIVRVRGNEILTAKTSRFDIAHHVAVEMSQQFNLLPIFSEVDPIRVFKQL